MAYLVIKRTTWGKGATLVKAKAQYLMAGGDDIDKVSVYTVPDDYYIDDWGNGHGSAPAVHVSGPDLRTS